MKKLLKTILGSAIFDKLKFSYSVRSRNIKEKELVGIREQFYRQFLNRGDLLFDVGANIGNRIQPMLNIGANVIAVEPQEKCIKYLNSRFGNKIELIPMGLGDKEDTIDFYISNADTISSFSTDWIDSVKNGRFKDHSWHKPIKIHITTLDNLIKKYGIPQFVKIDVEGYELEVLKGLNQPLKMISFEYTVPEQTQKALDCINQIEKYNPKIECNYSSGESMEFVFKNWLSVDNFKNYIATNEFISSGFGDIYVRTKASNDNGFPNIHTA